MKKIVSSFVIGFLIILVIIGAVNVVCFLALPLFWVLLRLALFLEYEVSNSDVDKFVHWYPNFAFNTNWIITTIIILTMCLLCFTVWLKIDKKKKAQKLSFG